MALSERKKEKVCGGDIGKGCQDWSCENVVEKGTRINYKGFINVCP